MVVAAESSSPRIPTPPPSPLLVVVASEGGERSETVSLLRGTSSSSTAAGSTVTSFPGTSIDPSPGLAGGRRSHLTTKREGDFQVPRATFVGVTLVLLAVTTTLGCLVSDLGAVFGLVGSTVTPLLSFVLPCLVYLRSGAAERYGHGTLAGLILLWGALLIPLGVVVYFLDLAGIL